MSQLSYISEDKASLRPLVSVCIANYNGEDILPQCLDSLFNQDAEFCFEVLVHDDSSKDNSLELLREFYPQVEVLSSLNNVGFCIANNRLVDRARGEYILLLNNDAALFPDALSTLVKECERHPDNGILTLPQYDWKSGHLVDYGSLLDPFYNPTPNLDPQRRDIAMVIGACLWMSRSRWNQVGGFPERFESFGEDLWICCKARLSGVTVRALDYSGFRHRQGHTFGGNRPYERKLVSNLRRRRLSERNKTFTLIVMTPSALMLPLLLLHFLLLLIEGAVLAICCRRIRIFSSVYLSVIKSVFGERSWLLKERRLAQARRKVSPLQYFRVFRPTSRKLAMLLKYGFPDVKNG